MSDGKLLTIAIPTYNRSGCLELLLDSIAGQLEEVGDQVQLIVVNNASSDDTEACCIRWKDRIQDLQYVRNDENIGAVLNVIKCFEMAETDYCWIIGDDDVVRKGVLRLLVELLSKNRPNLLYMNALGFSDKPQPENSAFSGVVKPRFVSPLDFSRLVNVYTTFISGMIVNKRTFLAGKKMEECNLIKDTLFPQLNWVFKNLNTTGRFIYIPQQLIQARAGASGGYNLYRSFSVDLVRMIDTGLARPVANAMKKRIVLCYLPGLIMSARTGRIGDFNVRPEERRYFRKCYSHYALYWLLVEPMLYFSTAVASYVLKLASWLSRVQVTVDHVRVRIKMRWAHGTVLP